MDVEWRAGERNRERLVRFGSPKGYGRGESDAICGICFQFDGNFDVDFICLAIEFDRERGFENDFLMISLILFRLLLHDFFVV